MFTPDQQALVLVVLAVCICAVVLAIIVKYGKESLAVGLVIAALFLVMAASGAWK